MDSLRLCLALCPVAVYLLVLGAVHLSRRPLLVSGGRDAAGLALAVSGLILVGPMEAIAPFDARVLLGPYVWLLLPVLYASCVVLWLLTMRPRLVLYNTTVDRLRPMLADVVGRLDAETRWMGDCLAMPGLGVQLCMEGFPAMKNVSLISVGRWQSRAGWRRLQSALAAAMVRDESGRDWRGLGLIAAGLLCLAVPMFFIARDPQATIQLLWDVAYALRQMVGLES